jgi:hypothetical protein
MVGSKEKIILDRCNYLKASAAAVSAVLIGTTASAQQGASKNNQPRAIWSLLTLDRMTISLNLIIRILMINCHFEVIPALKSD